MPDTRWTIEQQEAMTDFDHNLLVSAAAGSGKTAVLVERIINLIKEGKSNIDEMLIVTFTKAAAAEMREKIFRRLQEEGLDDQIERMGHADISSLDSFAFSIVKRYYYIIGVDPSLKTCDKTASALLKEEALDELFEKEFKNQSADFIYFLDCYDSSDDSDGAVRDMILRLHNFLMSMPHPWEYAEWAVNNGDELVLRYFDFAKERALLLLSKAIEYHRKFVGALESEGLDKLAAKAAEDLAYVEGLHAAIDQNPELGFELILEKHTAQRISLKKTALEARESEVKAYRDHAKDIIDGIKKSFGGLKLAQLRQEQAAMKRPISILFDLVKKFDDEFAEKKRLDKSLDFSDMNHFAISILENEDVCSEYKKQFKYIFIDEYQDTNSVQEAIITKIARENNLFMVGDVKQSIYKFRLAEPEIFMHYYCDYKSGKHEADKVIDLNMNFRSKANVIDSVNEVFSGLMTEESCGMVYDDAAALKKGSEYAGPIDYPVELRILNSGKRNDDDELVAELGKNELEALQAASLIKQYHGKLIHDDKTGQDRALDYKDMVILLRSTKYAGEVYYRTLLEADIPVYLDRSEGYFDSLEIQVFLNLLKIINNRKLDIPLLSVLCCPIFGFTANELAAVRIFGNEALGKPKASFSEVFLEYSLINEKAGAFIRMLDELKKESEILPLADFIYGLLLKTGYGDFASSQNGGEQKLANLKALVDKAEKFENDNLSGLPGFIRFAEILAKNSKNIDIGPAKTLSESANCVRIMTIHKSKGLEFPFVLVSNLYGSNITKSDSKTYAFHKEFGCAIKPVNPESNTYTDTKLLSILNMKKSLEARAEEIRILYVAFTRAVDVLQFSACKPVTESSFAEKDTILPGDVESAKQLLDLVYPCIPKERVKYTNKNSLAAFKKQSAETKESFRAAMEKGFAEYKDKNISDFINYPYFSKEQAPKKKYSVSELAEKARTGMDHYTLSSEDENVYYFETPQFFAEEKHHLNAAEKGTAYHAVMEHIDFSAENKDIDSIKAFIMSLSESNIITRAQAEAINPYRIKAFFESDIGRRAMATNELHREAPFVIKHNYDGHSVLVQGTIDCYFEEGGKYVLLDYKSNYIDKDNKEEEFVRLKESYIPQLELYKEALEITGKPVKEAVLYLFGTGDVLSIED